MQLVDSDTIQDTLLRDLLKETEMHLTHFLHKLELQPIKQLLALLMQLEGTLFICGVGKSGIIAKKVAMTLSSSGTKALYLSPLNALHGDIGIVSKGDVVLFLSKSGESDELLALCPAMRNKGATLVAAVSNADSRLVRASDMHVVLPLEKELCPFDMVPTTSALVQLMFGDLLAIALMRTKKFTMQDFAQNHPAGRLGKRMTFTVRDLMLRGGMLPLASPQDLLINALPDFSAKKCGCLMIIDEKGHLLGIFTDGDLRRSLQKFGATVLHKPLSELMTKSPRYINSELLAYDAMKLMESDPGRPITVLPVVENNGTIVGLLRMHDIVQSGL